MIAPIAILAASITTAGGTKEAVWEAGGEPCFAVTGTVSEVIAGNSSFTLFDDTGYSYMRTTNGIAPAKAAIVAVRGHIGVDANGWRRAFADSFETIGAGRVEPPAFAVAADLSNAAFDNKTVSIRGIVAAIERDEIDPAWCFMVMRTGGGNFLAAIHAPRNDAKLAHLTGAEVMLTGVANVLPDGGRRKFKMPQLTLPSTGSIEILVPAPASAKDAPQIVFDKDGIANGQYKSSAMISHMGLRRVAGTVLAVGRGKNVYLAVDGDQIVCATMAGGKLPACGERIVAAGFPDTDLFILKLEKAIWTVAQESAGPDAPCKVWPLAADALADEVMRLHYGHFVSLPCEILTVPSPEALPNESATAMHAGRIVEIDISAAPALCRALSPGDKIEATGLCVLNTSNWRADDIFPKIKGFSIIVRDPGDIRVTAGAPWLTSARLKAASAILLAATIGLLALVRALRKIIVRKSRQLLKAEIGKVEGELRIGERTRLAAEIHDAVSQYLAGVSFQVDAAAKTMPKNPAASGSFLSTAQKMLASCREELRRCLADLRSDALEKKTMDEAVRTALQPVLHDAELSVRFAVRREKLSDTTVHSILCIVRELAANAVRHGRARHVKIAGADDAERIMFSVRDDGCGFDGAVRRGPAEGHFGLQGVKERIAKLGGTFKIESAPGKGAIAKAEIRR